MSLDVLLGLQWGDEGKGKIVDAITNSYDIIDEILTKIPNEEILLEAPKKPKQVWVIKLLGANVSLGNIAWDEVIPLETLRIGLRGDTFFDYLTTNE